MISHDGATTLNGSVRVARWAAVLTGFALPISTAGTIAFSGLAALFALASPEARRSLARAVCHPVAVPALVLAALLALGIAWSKVPLGEAVHVWSKYRELLFMPVFLVLFGDGAWRRRGGSAFVAGASIAAILSMLMWAGWIEPFGKREFDFVPFRTRITHNVFLAFAAYLVAQEMASNIRARPWLAALLLVLAFDLLVIVQGRTGQVIFVLLVLLFGWQHARFKGMAMALMLTAALTAALISGADRVRARWVESGSGSLLATGLSEADEDTSTGQRLSFALNSLTLVREAPWFGSGTGSFAARYAEAATAEGRLATSHPHNEFLMIAVQLGSVGVAVLLWLLAAVGTAARGIDTVRRDAARALALAFGAGFLMNSFLLDLPEGHFFVYFAGLLCADDASRALS